MSTSSMARPMLMSAETEYSVSGKLHGRRQDPTTFFEPLRAAVCSEHRWMPDSQSRGSMGVFLENSARFYLEINGHPEYAQAEANTPLEVAAHDKAGERILQQAAQLAMQRHPGMELSIVKNNLDTYFPDHVTFGTHESYTCWDFPAAPAALLPHLASRIIFTGSGCLSGRPGGIGFELSQRARHIVHSVGNETTNERPLFCTRLRKRIDQSGQGYVRAHLISRDSVRLPLGTYLAFGTTGLLFHHLNQRRVTGSKLSLKSPVDALQSFSLDPWLRARVRLLDGREMTAIDIQQALLDECSAWQHHADVPDWAEEVLQHWAWTLDNLRRDPLRLADRLDAYLKLAVYTNQVERAGYRWTEIRDALRDLQLARATFPAAVMANLFEDSNPSLLPEHAEKLPVARRTFQNREPLMRFTSGLQILDYRYHILGDWCDDLIAAGQATHAPVTNDLIATAVTHAPPGNRAFRRGELVREHSGARDWLCDWASVFRHDGTEGFDLSDPFSNTMPPPIALEQRLQSRQRVPVTLMESETR